MVKFENMVVEDKNGQELSYYAKRTEFNRVNAILDSFKDSRELNKLFKETLEPDTMISNKPIINILIRKGFVRGTYARYIPGMNTWITCNKKLGALPIWEIDIVGIVQYYNK